MSEEQDQVKVEYEDFKEFHDKHPDFDNSDYYDEFPTVHKSTIRSWKMRARKVEPEPSNTPTPDTSLYDQEMVKILCTQAGVPLSDFEGVDVKTSIQILKNKLAAKQAAPAQRGSNSNILPTPRPIGAKKTEFGIDDYLEFDLEKNEIRMEVPLDEVMDPVKNEKIRKISRA